MKRGWQQIQTPPDWSYGGGVYALYRQSRLIYVGHTGNFRARLVDHRRRFGWDAVKIVRLKDRRECQRLERKLLFRLRPPCNGTLPTVLRPVGDYKGC